VHPFDIGARRLHRSRSIAWGTASWVQVESAASAHIDRPRLDAALLALIRSHPDIDIRLAGAGALSGSEPSRDYQLFDATGRRSRFARLKLAVEDAPVCQTWTRPLPAHEGGDAGPDGFQIAALAQGYVYRLRSASTELVGWCGSPELMSTGPDGWARVLSNAGLAWPELADANTGAPSAGWRRGKAGCAGPQRCEALPGIILVGDAAFARDVLCSQGLATGLSDAMYASAADSGSNLGAWNQHRLEQYARHLESLIALVRTCRFRDSGFWKSYARALTKEHAACSSAESDRTVCLRDGRIQAEVITV
jgi:hypothetical protein